MGAVRAIRRTGILVCIVAGLSTSVLSQIIPAGLRTMYRMMAAMYSACERMIMSDIS